MTTTHSPAAAPLVQPWTDMGLRMLDWMVSSTQEAGERMDRLARAGAAASPDELQDAQALQERASHTAGMVAGSALEAAMQWQGTMLAWTVQAWQQWFEAMGAMSRMAVPLQGSAGTQPGGDAARAAPPATTPSRPRATARGK